MFGKFINFLFSAKAPLCLAPWLCGAPLTALVKKSGGVRPIAVGEVFRWLASYLCCFTVWSRLPEVFSVFGQVGVGTSGGLEAAIHSVRLFVAQHCDDSDLILLKVDMKNAFNKCNRASFLARVSEFFSKISAWTCWCYTQPAELCFGDHRILASAGEQQGDPLGPLLSLVVLDFVRSAGLYNSACLSLWYLDDGTFIGPRSSLGALLPSFSEDEPAFGLHLNLAKCEVFWPSGDTTFPEFPVAVRRVGVISGGVELLGCPLWSRLDSLLIVLIEVFFACLRLIPYTW